MAYRIVGRKLVKENVNFLSITSTKRELFDALKLQVERAEAAEASAAQLEAKIVQLESEIQYLRSTDHAADVASEKYFNETVEHELRDRIEALET